MKPTLIHLGFTVGSGTPESIPLKHLAVIGQTQESGKTTTLEALVSRSGLRALAFLTKRGERSFTTGRRTAPYFRDQAGWQFVSSLLEATLGEKKRFERAWIQKACKGAHSLADVQRHTRELQAKSKRSMDQDMFMLLDSYLDIVVPQIRRLPSAVQLELGDGLNVMDLTPYTTEMQMLVIRSALEWIHEREEGVITIIPEAWEFVPESKGSPVKGPAESLVRKGAGLGNFVWIDSQDMAGVAKVLLRAATVWLIGVQREANEVRRNLSNIPGDFRRPSPAEIARLDKGQFYACWKDRTIKVYVQPAWLDEDQAVQVATGKLKVQDLAPPLRGETVPEAFQALRAAGGKGWDNIVDPEEFLGRKEWPVSKSIEDKLDEVLDFMKRGGAAQAAADAVVASAPVQAPAPSNEEALYQRFKARLLKESPALLKVLAQGPELVVSVERQTVEADGNTLRGRLARLIAEGYFDDPRAGNAAFDELKRRGFGTAKPNVYREMDKLAELGFVTKEDGGYQTVKGMKVNIVRK